MIYDYLIVGGGAAGLSLAYHISQEPRLADKKVLLLEPEAKDQNDRTWSFWTDKPSLFDRLALRTWTKIAFRAPGFEQVFDLGRYRYLTIRGPPLGMTASRVVLGLLISVGIGIVAGIVPAVLAANMDPVIAIRAK